MEDGKKEDGRLQIRIRKMGRRGWTWKMGDGRWKMEDG
jgi:hypothetical protein